MHWMRQKTLINVSLFSFHSFVKQTADGRIRVPMLQQCDRFWSRWLRSLGDKNQSKLFMSFSFNCINTIDSKCLKNWVLEQNKFSLERMKNILRSLELFSDHIIKAASDNTALKNLLIIKALPQASFWERVGNDKKFAEGEDMLCVKLIHS